MGVRRNLIGVAIAAVFAVGGTYLMLGEKSDEKTAADRLQVPTLVVTNAVAAGTSVAVLSETPGLAVVRLVDVESKNVDSLVSIADLASYKGLVLKADLAANRPLLSSSFVPRGSLSLAPGGVEIPPDLLQVSFSLEPQRALGGALRAGDRVAVIASLAAGTTSAPAAAQTRSGPQTHIVVQKALVANVQLSNLAPVNDRTASPDDGPTVLGNYTVTLALSAADSERLAFALENGTLWLAKQSATASGNDSRIWEAQHVLTDPVTDYAPPVS